MNKKDPEYNATMLKKQIHRFVELTCRIRYEIPKESFFWFA